MDYKHITLYLESGDTFRFNQITNYDAGKDFVSFNYVSASDGLNKVAVFRTNFLGISYCK